LENRLEPRSNALPWRYAAIAAGLLVSLWLLRQALMPFFVAMILAYLLGPLVDRLSRYTRRTVAVASILLFTIGLTAALLAWLVPFLYDQTVRLPASLPKWRALLDQKLTPLAQAHPYWADRIRQSIEGIDLGGAWGGILKAGSGLLQFFLSALTLILVPLILYHLLEGGQSMLQFLKGLVPPRHQARAQAMAQDINERLGGYIRGQLAVALVMSLLHGLAFQLLGVPYAWLLGCVAGFFNLIPYSPYLVALLPALVLVGLEGMGAGQLVLVAGVFTGVQKIEALYLTPVWVGRASKLHSLEVLLALIAFGHWFGLLGLLFAVPLMVCVRVVLERLLEDYRQTPWFTEETPTR